MSTAGPGDDEPVDPNVPPPLPGRVPEADAPTAEVPDGGEPLVDPLPPLPPLPPLTPPPDAAAPTGPAFETGAPGHSPLSGYGPPPANPWQGGQPGQAPSQGGYAPTPGYGAPGYGWGGSQQVEYPNGTMILVFGILG